MRGTALPQRQIAIAPSNQITFWFIQDKGLTAGIPRNRGRFRPLQPIQIYKIAVRPFYEPNFFFMWTYVLLVGLAYEKHWNPKNCASQNFEVKKKYFDLKEFPVSSDIRLFSFHIFYVKQYGIIFDLPIVSILVLLYHFTHKIYILYQLKKCIILHSIQLKHQIEPYTSLD